MRLFADDCVIYKPTTTLQDAEHLQENLQILSEWTKLALAAKTKSDCHYVSDFARDEVVPD